MECGEAQRKLYPERKETAAVVVPVANAASFKWPHPLKHKSSCLPDWAVSKNCQQSGHKVPPNKESKNGRGPGDPWWEVAKGQWENNDPCLP